MSDGRTDLYKEVWKRTTTFDHLKADQYPIGTTPEQQASWKTELEHMPNQKKHRNVSFAKSAVRIIGFGALWVSVDIAATLLILAEVIGIYEELV